MDKLELFYSKLERGQASFEEKIEAISLASEKHDFAAIQCLFKLAEDQADAVRFIALEAIVFELKLRTEDVVDLCWSALQNDVDEDVRFTAASGLARLFHGSFRLGIFERLMRVMLNEPEDSYVRLGIYNALIRLIGAPPSEWLGVKLPREQLIGGSAVDFRELGRVEELLRAHAEKELAE